MINCISYNQQLGVEYSNENDFFIGFNNIFKTGPQTGTTSSVAAIRNERLYIGGGNIFDGYGTGSTYTYYPPTSNAVGIVSTIADTDYTNKSVSWTDLDNFDFSLASSLGRVALGNFIDDYTQSDEEVGVWQYPEGDAIPLAEYVCRR